MKNFFIELIRVPNAVGDILTYVVKLVLLIIIAAIIALICYLYSKAVEYYNLAKKGAEKFAECFPPPNSESNVFQ